MVDLNSFRSQWSPRLLSVLRIITAFLYMQHGGQKLFGFPAPPHSEFPLLSLIGIAGILEFFGGLLLLFGLFTRPVAFLLSGQMAVAYFMAQAPPRILAITEPRRAGGTILFCVSLSGCGRRRSVEPRLSMAPE
jgi:putative oxidoreductase